MSTQTAQNFGCDEASTKNGRALVLKSARLWGKVWSVHAIAVAITRHPSPGFV